MLIPAILQKKPKKIVEKKFEISDCRIGVWMRAQTDVSKKDGKAKERIERQKVLVTGQQTDSSVSSSLAACRPSPFSHP